MRRHLLLVALTLLVLTSFVYIWTSSFEAVSLPFNVTLLDARTAVISPLRGTPLPTGLQAGDVIDLVALDPRARSAIGALSSVSIGRHQPRGVRYDLVLHRGGAESRVTVETVDLEPTAGIRWFQWVSVLAATMFGLTGLLALWRGRDWPAVNMTLWMFANVIAIALSILPADGVKSVVLLFLSGLMYMLARVGFYFMIESMVRRYLSARAQTLFRAAFAALLLAGLCTLPSAGLVYYVTGWAGLLWRGLGVVLVLSYLPPIALLAFAYRKAEAAHRLRLRWSMWASGLLVFAIAVNDTVLLGFPATYIVGFVAALLSNLCFLYAVLRHRVVDVAIIIDRALVYGLVTTLVVGVIAAVNSLVLRFALPPGAGIVLQVVVPLSLGIVLSKVRALMDKAVEQMFFRRRYLAGQALRDFAKRAVHIDRVQDLFEATAREVSRYTGSSAVAVYSAESAGFKRLLHAGADGYPAMLNNNDDAVLALRAEGLATDLRRLTSALGTDSCVFPMLVFGNLRGLIVVKNRTGEHFDADEKTLLTEVAQDVGSAWRILRARENEALVLALAERRVPTLEVACDQAQALRLSWGG